MFGVLPSSVRRGLRFRAEIAGVIAGLLVLLLGDWLRSFPLGQTAFLAQLGTTVSLAMAAAFIAVQTARWSKIPGPMASSVGAGMGLRAGLVTALCAGSILTANALIRYNRIEFADEASLAHSRLMWTLFVATAGVLPAVYLGFLSGTASGLIRAGVADQASMPLAVDDESQGKGNAKIMEWLSKAVILIPIAGLASPLSLFLLAEKKPRPPLLPVTVQAPSVPLWNYVRPEGWPDVALQRIQITHIYEFTDYQPGSSVAISPDSNWLAYCSADKAAVAIVDLQLGRKFSTHVFDADPTAVAWSPDSGRIMVLTENVKQGSRLHHIRRGEPAIVTIPLGNAGDLPKPPMRWLSEAEILFQPGDEPALLFNLNDLRLYPATDVPSGPDNSRKALDWKSIYPTSKAWRMEAGESILEVQAPSRRQSVSERTTVDAQCLAFSHPDLPVKRAFPDVPLVTGDTIVPAIDGSKVARIQGSKIQVYYFGAKPAEGLEYHLSVPQVKSEAGNDANFRRVLQDIRLCAMVYAPLVNPLNGKVIGPSRTQPKGILRFSKWQDEKAILWAGETYEILSPNDVVADIHFWEEGKCWTFPGVIDPHWWTLLGTSAELGSDTIPESALPLSLHWQPTYKAFGSSGLTVIDNRVTEPVPPASLPGKNAPVVIPKDVFTAPEYSKYPSNPVPQQPSGINAPSDGSVTPDIVRFVIAHHNKATSGDVEGMGSDYEDGLLFLGKYKTRKQIVEETREYRKRWPSVKETVLYPIKVSPEGDFFVAEYTVEFMTTNSAGDWIKGRNNITLRIGKSNGRFFIVQQDARVFDRTSNKPLGR